MPKCPKCGSNFSWSNYDIEMGKVAAPKLCIKCQPKEETGSYFKDVTMSEQTKSRKRKKKDREPELEQPFEESTDVLGSY